MTVLGGDTGFTGYSGSGPSAADGGYVAAIPFIAVSDGVATSLNAWITPGAATQFVMALYDATGQRLAYSAPVTVQAAGLINFPIAPTPLKALQAYIPNLISNSGDFQFGVNTSLFSQAFSSPGANADFPVPVYQLNGGVNTIFGAPTFFIDGDAQAQTLVSSGTTGQTVFDTATLITRAFNRCRVRSAAISDEMVAIAKDELTLFTTSDLANRGIQLFAVDIQLVGMTSGQKDITMPAGTIDVLSANIRTLAPLQLSNSTTYNPPTPTQVTTVAITWGSSAVPFLIQNNQAGAMQTVLSVTPNASPGQTTFHDIDGAVAASAWQVIANPVPPTVLPLTVTSVGFYNTLYQVPMAPYSRDDYVNISNPFFSGRPFQFWLDRQEPWPIMRLWPVPGTNEQNNACLVIWRHKQIQDVGELAQKLAVPTRWLTAVIDGLAYRLSKAIVEVDANLIPVLKADAAESLNNARNEERENAPFRILPRISGYTR